MQEIKDGLEIVKCLPADPPSKYAVSCSERVSTHRKRCGGSHDRGLHLALWGQSRSKDEVVGRTGEDHRRGGSPVGPRKQTVVLMKKVRKELPGES